MSLKIEYLSNPKDCPYAHAQPIVHDNGPRGAAVLISIGVTAVALTCVGLWVYSKRAPETPHSVRTSLMASTPAPK